MSIAEVFSNKVKTFILKNGNEKKIIFGAIIVNIFYWFYNFYTTSGYAVIASDYFQNFYTAVHQFLINPTTIYSISGNAFQIPFRNLPSAIFYYMIFSGLPHDIKADYYVCTAWIIIWNIGSCILINEIMKLKKFKEIQGKSIFTIPAIIIAFYLLNLWQEQEFYQGNTNVITGFFVLLGVYFFLSERERYGFMAWSIAITFKITIIFLIIFFIFRPPFKRFLKNLMYALIPQIPNFVMFGLWPNLITDYITFNVSVAVNMPFFFYHTGSIGREISYYFSVPLLPLVIPLFVVIFTLNFILCYKSRDLTFINRLMLAFFTAITAFPDFYGKHILFFLPVYLFWLASQNNPIFSKSARILVFLPVISFIFYLGISVLPFPSLSLFFLIPLILIDYRLIISLKRKAPAIIINQQ